MDIFKGGAGVVAEDFVGAPALGKEVNNEFNGEVSAFDDGLANEDA